MRELVDSIALRGDKAGLRQRLAADGYLFFRRLLQPADVQAAYDSVRAELHIGGWLELTPQHGNNGRADPHSNDANRIAGSRERLADPSFRAALASRALNRLAYLPRLRGLVRLILGAGAFCYPVKVLRVVYPERRGEITRSRYVQQDFGVTGVQDMLTTWLPLMDIPLELGGPALLPRSHLGPPLLPELLPADEPGWATTDFQPGDMLLFHCLTAHAALPNHTDRVHLSADFRWQAADQPAPAELVLGRAAVQGGKRGQVELYSRLLSAEP
ncbi:MAG: phytanoyl-CoA dioxygenase family protein, partial [Actinobacteria bacterium]|nr:phytanoyl-CoA dioxygenase family protein [Actinomycetota bacterium]